MNALLLAVTLVLHSGDRLPVEGNVREENGVVYFRNAGLWYSVPASEVLRVDTVDETAQEKRVTRLRVSGEERKRLIAELEQNHSGKPNNVAPPRLPLVVEAPRVEPEDEAIWRSQARAHEEHVIRAKEELALLEQRAEQLQWEINSFFSLGYKPRQFTYQTTQLARTLERIPYARLEVTRAERAYARFREDARKAGVLPGWLR